MIIKTENNNYIVKFRKSFKIYDETNVDNYGRIHNLVWKEPMITCTVKEYKPHLTDSFCTWSGTSWCRYTDNFDEKYGYESALNKALAVSTLSDTEKKSIAELVLAQTKISTVVKPFMFTIDKKEFIREINEERLKGALCHSTLE